MAPAWIDGFSKVIGKRIQGLIVVKHLHPSMQRVFLIFDDDTHYELYGPEFWGCKDIDLYGFDKVKKHVSSDRNAEILFESKLD